MFARSGAQHLPRLRSAQRVTYAFSTLSLKSVHWTDSTRLWRARSPSIPIICFYPKQKRYPSGYRFVLEQMMFARSGAQHLPRLRSAQRVTYAFSTLSLKSVHWTDSTRLWRARSPSIPIICFYPKQKRYPSGYRFVLEQMMGIEPTRSAWKAEVLPLNYICIGEYALNTLDYSILSGFCQSLSGLSMR